jgi:DUF4097 and DUF4098 domain-containing protein YvlB
MNKILLLALLAGLSVPGLAQKTPYMTKSLSSSELQNVEAKTSGGSIEISGGHSQDARIEVYISGNGRHMNLTNEEVKARLDRDFDFDISVTDHKLTAKALPKNRIMNWNNSLSISFRIFVPENLSSKLTTSGGSISISKLSGDEDFSTSGGSLTVDGLSGKIKGTTSGGSIHLSSSKGLIDMETSGGGINAEHCSGNLHFGTSGGSLGLVDLQGEIRASTSGGSVDGESIGGELITSTSGGSIDLRSLSCSLDASTSGGNINADIKEVGKYVKLRDSGGHIDLRIPAGKGYDLKLYGDGMDKNINLNNFSGTVKDDKIEGTVNGGGIPVYAQTSGGRVNLSFR